VHIGVARADQLVIGGVGRLAGHEQNRQPAAVGIVHGVGGVGGADVDMHQHALAASGHEGVALRHVRRRILVRAVQHARNRLAAFLAVRHFLDDRRMVGAEIAEQVFDTELVQAFEEIIGGGEIRGVGVAGDWRVHGWCSLLSGFLRGVFSGCEA
jgi:hypothetical protein